MLLSVYLFIMTQPGRDLRGALGYLAHARDLQPAHGGVHFFFGIVCMDLDLGVEAHNALKAGRWPYGRLSA